MITMRVTGIRDKNGKKLEPWELDIICQRLTRHLEEIGFITEAEPVNGTSIHIGLRMRSFKINTAHLGYNGRFGAYVKSVKGYKRTDVPTWDQRVSFNNLVNKVFDRAKLTAKIVSGQFLIRDKERGAYNEWHWKDQVPNNMDSEGGIYNGIGQLCTKVLSEDECRERLDSDEREKEHKEKLKALSVIKRVKLVPQWCEPSLGF